MSTHDDPRAESIRRRLRNLLRERGEDIQFGLQRYAVERFLYRLGVSPHRDQFILKGAALFALWGGAAYRPTRDLDFAAYGTPDETRVLAALREVCLLPDMTDLLTFDPATLRAEPTRPESEYHGLRIHLVASLGGSRIPLQIDLGFGDAIEPPPQEAQYPTLLDDPPPTIRVYPREAVIAEKLHAMVILGGINSRYKDFYDVYVLAGQFPFDGRLLASAITATFERRQTPIEAVLPTALTPAFYAAAGRAEQWRAYVTRNALPGVPQDFAPIGEAVQAFLGPLWQALGARRTFASRWKPGGPWEAQA